MEPWEHAERAVSKRTGGRRQPGSGCGAKHKGDILTDRYLIEVKSTENTHQFRLYRVWLDKILLESEQVGRMPALVVRHQRTGVEYWFTLRRQKSEPSDPGWRVQQIDLYPTCSVEEVESLLAIWSVGPAPRDLHDRNG